MLKAEIPSSGEKLLRIGLGTYRSFDVGNNQIQRDELKKVLNFFVSAGGSLIDSSPMYGSAEKVVGDLSQEIGLNDKLFIATKVWTTGEKKGLDEMQDSIRKLGRKKIELMQIHNLVDYKVHLKSLRKMKDQGLIRYIGITHYNTAAFNEMENIISKESLDFIQIPYSISETTAIKSLVPRAHSKNIAVIANEPFSQGELFRRVQNKPLPKIAFELDIKTWSQYFLKFILASPEIQFTIPATGNLEHLKDNMKAAEGVLPDSTQRAQMLKVLMAL